MSPSPLTSNGSSWLLTLPPFRTGVLFRVPDLWEAGSWSIASPQSTNEMAQSSTIAAPPATRAVPAVRVGRGDSELSMGCFFFLGGGEEDVGEDGERQRTFEKHNPEQQQQQQQQRRQRQQQQQQQQRQQQKTAKLAATKSRVICYILDTVCIVDEIPPIYIGTIVSQKDLNG